MRPFSRSFVSLVLPGLGPLEVSAWVRAGLAVGRLLVVEGRAYVVPVSCCPDDCSELICVNNSWWFWMPGDES